MHRGEIRQVALHDLGAEPAQRFGALILPPDQGAHLVALGEQHCGEVAADGADSAGGSGHEDRAVMCRFRRHIAYSVFGMLYGLIITRPKRWSKNTLVYNRVSRPHGRADLTIPSALSLLRRASLNTLTHRARLRRYRMMRSHLANGLAFASPAASQRFEYRNLVLHECGIG